MERRIEMTVEEGAMLLDRTSVMRVVSARRKLRDAASALLRARYGDGEVDAVALTALEAACRDAAEDLEETFP
jgi:hypothetical protein